MLPVAIVAKYYSSTRSAVSERSNLTARLVLVRLVLQSSQAYSLACYKHSPIATCRVLPHTTMTPVALSWPARMEPMQNFEN